MPINVICPGCHTRFKVSEKFAGKTGACPKCKGKIEVPSADDQVVIHEPELEAGAKDARGRSVLKPVRRTDSKFNPFIFVGAVGLSIIAVVVAYSQRSAAQPSWMIMTAGSLLVAVPLSWAGYSFLRDDELEAYQGISLMVRTLICAAGYAGLWGVYAVLYPRLFGDSPLEIWNVLMLLPFLAVGAGIALVCYDLDFGSGFFHYCLYLTATILLRLIMGLPVLGPRADDSSATVTFLSLLSNLTNLAC